MAESAIWSQLTVDWFGLSADTYITSNQSVSPDNDSNSRDDYNSEHQRRSDIVHSIIYNRRLDHLQSILGNGWDMNEMLVTPKNHKSDEGEINLPRHHTGEPWTALGEAVRWDWTDGVRILFDAGAKCKMPSVPQNILILAKTDPVYANGHASSPDLIELLLKHGADPNDHDGGLSDHIPLFFALTHNYEDDQVVKLLLEYGADPNVIGKNRYKNDIKQCPLSVAMDANDVHEVVPLLKLLIQFGADLNFNIDGSLCLLHSLMGSCMVSNACFHREQMDLYFANGGDVNIADGKEGTALEYATMMNFSSNCIRWLIRHGADTTTLDIIMLGEYLTCPDLWETYGTPLILLQAGMRVSHGVQAWLRNMEIAITEWERDDELDDHELEKRLNALWDPLVEAEQPRRIKRKARKLTFPEHLAHQMDDLQEFSDESLNVYPEVDGMEDEWWQNLSCYIRKMQDFMSQPQPLQWYCRRCVRGNLVSLQPSVMKTLLVPAILKRYILCHEI